MASRFSATHSLAVFNTAIVHELSQPLQAIALSLETLQMKSRQHDASELETQIQNTLDLTSRMGLTLATLRQLVSTQKADLEVVNIKLLLHNTIPILQAESQRHGVSLTLSNLHPDVCVIANKVLLERIIINLIANALDAIRAQANGSAPSTITVKSHCPSQPSHPVWQLVVSDSGPGIPEDIMASISQPFQSTKETGLGIGLALANMMLRMWQGTLSVRNKTQAEGLGAEVSIQIPLQTPSITHG